MNAVTKGKRMCIKSHPEQSNLALAQVRNTRFLWLQSLRPDELLTDLKDVYLPYGR